MLTVHKVTSSNAGSFAEYLLGEQAPDRVGDYYLKGGERTASPGQWRVGPKAAEFLEIDVREDVDGTSFRELMAARNPATGEQLRRATSGDAVASIDMTFAPPKDVSVIWALGSESTRERIEEIHDESITEALGHMVEQVAIIRRRHDRETVLHEPAAEIAASAWRHTTARASKTAMPMMHLHDHVQLHGAIRSDGKFVAIDSYAVMQHQREIGAYYRAAMAHRLKNELGLSVVTGTGSKGRYFAIDGIEQGVRDHFSPRHHEIRKEFERVGAERRAQWQERAKGEGVDAQSAKLALARFDEHGKLSPAEQRTIAKKTRAPKDAIEEFGDLEAIWQREGKKFELNEKAIDGLLGRAKPARLELDLEGEILAKLTEFEARFRDRDGRATALEVGAAAGPKVALAAYEQLVERGRIIEAGSGRFTTVAHRQLEEATIEAVGNIAAGRVERIEPAIVDQETARLNDRFAAKGGGLAHEQARAIEMLCGDRQLVMVRGRAGTGKSSVLEGAARAAQQEGYRIVVVSTAGETAQRLGNDLREAGVHAVSCSIAQMRGAVNAGRLPVGPGMIIIHDEAAVTDTRDTAFLARTVHEFGPRWWAVGDSAQNLPVGAGGLYPVQEAIGESELGVCELAVNMRARDEADADVQDLWREGFHEEALTSMLERDRIEVLSTESEAREAAVAAWARDELGMSDASGSRTRLICSTSNDDLAEVNARAQLARMKNHELGEIGAQVPGQPYDLHKWDHVVIRQNIAHPNAEGGRLLNGTQATVLEVARDAESVVIGARGHANAIRLDVEQLEQADVRLAYATHPFPSQGMTLDTVHILDADGSNANSTYVALTRAREETKLYTSLEQLRLDGDASAAEIVERLAARFGKDSVELPSIELPEVYESSIERQHESEHSAAELPMRESVEDATERLEAIQELVIERNKLDQRKSEISGIARQFERAVDRLSEATDRLSGHLERLNAASGRFEQLGLLKRHGAEGEQLKDQIASASWLARHWQEAVKNREGELRDILRAHPQARELVAEHRSVTGRLDEIRSELRDQMSDRIKELSRDTPEYLRAELGERPKDAGAAQAWDRGVKEIELYRAAYGVTDQNAALGAREKLPPAQAADLKSVQRDVSLAHQRLNPDRSFGLSR